MSNDGVRQELRSETDGHNSDTDAAVTLSDTLSTTTPVASPRREAPPRLLGELPPTAPEEPATASPWCTCPAAAEELGTATSATRAGIPTAAWTSLDEVNLATELQHPVPTPSCAPRCGAPWCVLCSRLRSDLRTVPATLPRHRARGSCFYWCRATGQSSRVRARRLDATAARSSRQQRQAGDLGDGQTAPSLRAGENGRIDPGTPYPYCGRAGAG